MKIATIVAIILAIALAVVAVLLMPDTTQPPIVPDSTTINGGITRTDKQKLSSISSYSLEAALIGTIEDGVYRSNDYSQFYSVSENGFSHLGEAKEAKTTVTVSDEQCQLVIRYVESNGRVVGGGEYKAVLVQEGIYSVELNLKYTLTEIPSALGGQQGEKMLLVGFSSDDYYSYAFAVDLSTGNSRNLFAQETREVSASDGYVMLTDELVKNSGEYLYFFSSRLYDRESEESSFNEYKNIDLFRTNGTETELVASKAHHMYVSDVDDESICFVRSEYATLTQDIGGYQTTTIQEISFDVLHLNLTTMTETVIMTSNTSYSSGYQRFGDCLVRFSEEISSTVEVFDMVNNRQTLCTGMKMKTLSGFDVSDDGRYIAVGGSVSTASTINQNVCIIDTVSGQTVSLSDKGLFLAIEGNFGFVGSEYFINASYEGVATQVVFYLTKTSGIMETFKEGAEEK